MKPRPSPLAMVATLACVATLAFLGCSKSTGPTSPGVVPSTGGSGNGNAAFDSGTLNPPSRFVHVFAVAGTVNYHCRFHVSMGMRGTVTVTSGGADSAIVRTDGVAFVPSTVSIRPGGFVRWDVNDDVHTVTSN